MGKTQLFASGRNTWKSRPVKNGTRQKQALATFTRILPEACGTTRDLQTYASHTIVIAVKETGLERRYVGDINKYLRAMYDHPNFKRCAVLAVSGNGKVAVKFYGDNIRMYVSASAALDNEHEFDAYPGTQRVIEIAGYAVGFVALDIDGRVFTWGDPNHPGCLGRPLTYNDPADVASEVQGLRNLPTGKVTRVAANGLMLAALTKGGALYWWGRSNHSLMACLFENFRFTPKPMDARGKFAEDIGVGKAHHVVRLNEVIALKLADLQGKFGEDLEVGEAHPVVREDEVITPTLVDVQGKFVEDVGVGEAHLIVVTEDEEILVAGDNTHGQLGIETDKATEWTPVHLPIPAQNGYHISHVRAGPKSSFVLVEELKESVDEWEWDAVTDAFGNPEKRKSRREESHRLRKKCRLASPSRSRPGDPRVADGYCRRHSGPREEIPEGTLGLLA